MESVADVIWDERLKAKGKRNKAISDIEKSKSGKSLNLMNPGSDDFFRI
jgi:hypothetical protein